MNFIWEGGNNWLRAGLTESVRVQSVGWDGKLNHHCFSAVGYVHTDEDGVYIAAIYRTVSDVHPRKFSNLSQAKAWVEEQGLVGLTLKKLHVDV